jgi:hypothetical protein
MRGVSFAGDRKIAFIDAEAAYQLFDTQSSSKGVFLA